MNKAFTVDLGQYQSPSETHRGYEGPVLVPTNLVDIVEGVFGQVNRQLARPLIVHAEAPLAITPLTPPEVAMLYRFPAVSAAGQTTGIIEFGGGYQITDVQDYFNTVVSLPVPNLTSVGVDGATNSPSGGGDDIEVILDISVAGSVAPGAKIVVYFTPNSEQGFLDVLTTALNDTTNNPMVLSISWLWPEQSWVTSLSSLMGGFSEIGVTVFAASGDSGSSTGVNYPASDPWVTGCGGTTVENVSGTSSTQVAWVGSGGGISNVFQLPDWQNLAGIPPSVTSSPPGHIGRGVPDIAGNGDPNSGYKLILNGVSTGLWGGTSAVAPLYAGFVALLNATLGKMADLKMGPVGYLNNDLYAPAGPYVYNDVTSGSNGGYNAGPGWDAVTGWGSINGKCLSLRIQIAAVNNELEALANDLENIDELPANKREAARKAILAQKREENGDLSILDEFLQDCMSH